MMPAKKKPENTSRSETVTVRLDPKLRYLADLAAREQQRTLSSFIEWSVRRALSQSDILEEPNYGANPEAKREAAPLWGEGFWDVDESDRFFLLAVGRPDLLTIDEQRFWKLYCLTQKKISLETFRKFWNAPAIDTTHLKSNESGE
jgi:hypothetical protein